jgi:hypothetical protein
MFKKATWKFRCFWTPKDIFDWANMGIENSNTRGCLITHVQIEIYGRAVTSSMTALNDNFDSNSYQKSIYIATVVDALAI